MVKPISRYICQNCGASAVKWLGKCPQCGDWDTYQEEIVRRGTPTLSKNKVAGRQTSVPTSLPNIEMGNFRRSGVMDPELNRVLGGGIVQGSIILLAGEPGIGKSTLLLQLGQDVDLTILYVSGEESEEQIKLRAQRLGISSEKCFVYAETNVENIITQSEKLKPDILIIDSVQTLNTPHVQSAPGSVSQVRDCAYALQQFGKAMGISVFLIGHITKEGSIAGPKVLEHVVDVVLQFEGDQHYQYRVLRSVKNRFGASFELGIYQMVGEGLKPVLNPSELLISQSGETLSGSSIAAAIEGLRPIMIETQALVSTAVYGTAQRSTTGYDLRRLHMLLAVLEKRCGFFFGNQDVFLNIAGGIRLSDPGLDLALVAALVSSLQDIPLSNQTAFCGEIGLSGEIRAVNHIEKRIQEAQRLGFESIFIPAHHLDRLKSKDFAIQLHGIGNLRQLFEEILG